MKTIVGITTDLNAEQLSKLDNFVKHYNKISHRLYVDLFIKKQSIKDLSPLYQNKYSINKRHFDSIRIVLEGKVSSILALNKDYIIDIKDKIKKIEKELLIQNKSFKSYQEEKKKNAYLSQVKHNLKKNLSIKISYNRQRLNKLKVKLDQLEDINKTSNVKLCFGSKKLFRQQFLINTSNNKTAFKTHEQWYDEFNYQRNKEFTFIGSKDESAGNLNCQISYLKDNLFKLKININPKAINPIDKYLELTFKMNHDLEKLKEIIFNNNSKNKELWQALTYKLIKQKTKYHKDKYVVAISFERNLIKNIKTNKDNGCIGVDINQDHLAISELDNKGNLLNIKTFNYDLNGTKHQNQNSISLAVKDLMNIAVKLNKLIVIEKLDFREKKKNLSLAKYQNKKRNKQLSSFAYSKIIELIKARAEDNNIEVKEINPAYTSIIGKIKYSERNKIDVHHGAAMCIGRKGLFNKENQVNKENKKYKKYYKEKRISMKNRQIKNSILPVRNRLNAVVYWKELQENIIKNKRHEKENNRNVVSKSTSLGCSNMSVMNASVEALL